MVLEDIVRRASGCAQLRAVPLGAVIDGFVGSVASTGYTPVSLRNLFVGMKKLNGFLADKGIADLRELRRQHLDEFISGLRVYRCLGKYSVRYSAGTRAVWHLLRYLRGIGLAPAEPLALSPVYAQLLDEWLSFLRQHRGLASKTLVLYRNPVTLFLESLGPNATPTCLGRLTPANVRSFVQQRATVLGRSERKTLVTALRVFLRFALSCGYLPRDLTVAVDRVPCFKHEHLPRGPRWDDVVQLPATADRNTAKGKRDYAILLVLLTYGIRAGQISCLHLESLDWRSNKIRFQAAKMGRELELPLTHPVGEAIMDYLRHGRPHTSTRVLFVSTDPPFGPLLAKSFYGVVSHAFQMAGIESPHRGSHAIRHAWATHMLSEGHTLKTIADLLGHRSIETTRIYAKVDHGRLREVAAPWPLEEEP